ncbi:unnamed protein product [Arabis nemorensis]|uniref:Jacalin-type lectin domain-containing protein n=1 Tax=Arabis nemorensis TaxID=586526 RepID=A0A565BPK9_9BRAS|nr:unnamed protein product [Arabis nemorensis]
MHGSHGCSKRIVRLNHESEFVTGISGEVYDGGLISSLTFHTNQRKDEAFHLTLNIGKTGPPMKMEFHSGILERCEFEGFFGAHDDTYLSTINFSVRHIFHDIETIK